MPWGAWLAFAGLLVLLSASPHAHAQTGAAELVAPQQGLVAKTAAALGQIQQEDPARYTLNGMVEAGTGQGGFLSSRYARNPYAVWAASLVPAYYPIPELTLSLFAKLAQEITDSDFDTRRYQPISYDMQLRALYAPPTIPTLKIASFVETRVYLPTSLVSRYETLIAGAQTLLSLVRNFDPIVLRLVGSFRKNFHRYESPVVDPGDSASTLHARLGGAEDLRGESIAIAGNNVSFSVVGAVAASYVPISELGVTLSYGASSAFTYRKYPDDELASEHAKAGRGQRDMAFGALDIWYAFNRRLSLSGGIFTAATPKSEDNRSFRFPFYDLHSTAMNLTTFYFTLMVTEYLGG